MSHFKAKMHQIRFLASVSLSVFFLFIRLFLCPFVSGGWSLTQCRHRRSGAHQLLIISNTDCVEIRFVVSSCHPSFTASVRSVYFVISELRSGWRETTGHHRRPSGGRRYTGWPKKVIHYTNLSIRRNDA